MSIQSRRLTAIVLLALVSAIGIGAVVLRARARREPQSAPVPASARVKRQPGVEPIGQTLEPADGATSGESLSLAQTQGAAIGGLAPIFDLPILAGGAQLSLAEFRGQVVLVNFWASWCLPCRLETPILERAAGTYGDQGLVIVGINSAAQDDLAAALDFAEEFRITYPLLWDEADATPNAYGVYGLPTSVLIDRDGRVATVEIGALDEKDLDGFFEEALR